MPRTLCSRLWSAISLCGEWDPDSRAASLFLPARWRCGKKAEALDTARGKPQWLQTPSDLTAQRGQGTRSRRLEEPCPQGPESWSTKPPVRSARVDHRGRGRHSPPGNLRPDSPPPAPPPAPTWQAVLSAGPVSAQGRPPAPRPIESGSARPGWGGMRRSVNVTPGAHKEAGRGRTPLKDGPRRGGCCERSPEGQLRGRGPAETRQE